MKEGETVAEFTILPRNVRQTAGSIGNYSRRMSGYQMRISSVRTVVSSMSSIAGVRSALNTLESRTVHHARTLSNMQVALNNCVTKYETAERLSAGKSVSIWESIIQGYFDNHKPGWKLFDTEKTSSWYEKSISGALARYRGEGKDSITFLGGTASAGLAGGLFSYKDKDAWGKISRGDGKFGKKYVDEHWVRDKDGQYMIPDTVEYAKKKATFAEVSAEAKAEGSLFERSWGNDNANAQVAVGKAEVHANAKAGIYGYDKYGKKVWSPAVEATVGGSVCVLNAKGEAKVGGDMLNAGVDGEVSVGKASAEATASAKLFGRDEKGNWAPELKASASAEAIAAEAKGSAHVTVAGVEAKVNGSVNFGVGAHADIGMVDGKIKCDIGASLGVGASVGFEIDTKPLVKAVTSGAKALWPGNWFK